MSDVPTIVITARSDAGPTIDKVANSLGNLEGIVHGVKSALEGLGVGLSFAGLAEMAKTSFDLAVSMQHLSERTGASVKSLSELRAAAVLSGGGMDTVTTSLDRLAKSMAATSDPASRQAQIFASLGISIRDASGKMKDGVEVMRELARALEPFEDGANKVAIVLELMGRGAAENLPMFHELANANTELATVTEDSAKKAQELEHALGSLKLQGEATFQAMTSEWTPVLRDFIKEYQAGLGVTGSAIGSIVANVKIAYGGPLLNQMEEIKAEIASLEKGELHWYALTDSARKTAIEGYKTQLALIQKILHAEISANPLADVQMPAGFGKQAPGLPNAAAADATKAVTSALEGMVLSLKKALASTEGLGAADKVFIELQQQKYAALTKVQSALAKEAVYYAALDDMQKEAVGETKAENDAMKLQYELLAKDLEKRKQQGDAYLHAANSADQFVSNLELEVSTMALSNDERERAIALHRLNAEGLNQEGEAYREFAARLKSALDAKQTMGPWIDAMHSVQQAAEDAFTHILDKGTNVWKQLTETLKTTFLKLLYDISIKKWVVGITASVTGGAAGAANAAEGAAGSALGSAGGMFANLGGGAITGAAGDLLGFGAATSAGIEAGSALLDFGATTAEAILGGLEVGLAAVPVAGWIALAGLIVYQVVAGMKKGGPKTGGEAASGLTLGIHDTDSSGMRWGTPNDQDSAAQKLVDNLQAQYNAYVKAFGGANIATFRQMFYSDPQGDSPSNVHTGAFNTKTGQQIIDLKNPNVGRDDASMQAELTLQGERAIIGALKQSDLPGALGKLFDSVDATTISQAAAQDLLTFAAALQSLYKVFNSDPVADALDIIGEAAKGASGALDKQRDALQAQLDVYDGTTQATTDLASATAAYYTNVVALIVQIENLKTSIRNMFADSIKTYTFSKLDTQGQYAYLVNDAASLTKQLNSATNPDDINRLAAAINADQQQAFGLLTPEQQAASADGFIKGANAINELAQKKLTDAETAAQTQLDTILTSIKSAIDGAATQFSAAAGVVGGAGVSMNDAAAHIDHAASSLEAGTRPLVTG